MDFKQKSNAFKHSCRMYESEKKHLQSLSDSDEMLARFLREDIEFTEKILSGIEKRFGTEARNAVYALTAEERTQLDVAYSMGISRRKLQNLVNRWLHTVFEETE